jgi:hypothetical protein
LVADDSQIAKSQAALGSRQLVRLPCSSTWKSSKLEVLTQNKSFSQIWQDLGISSLENLERGKKKAV